MAPIGISGLSASALCQVTSITIVNRQLSFKLLTTNNAIWHCPLEDRFSGNKKSGIAGSGQD